MSYQERLVQTAQSVSEDTARMLFFIMRQYLLALEEAEDEAFCKKLLEDALADPEKEDYVDFEEACRLAGVNVA